jgi:ribose-phosphate pyrophosphokinase
VVLCSRKHPILVDLEAAANALRVRGSAPEIMAVAAHALLVGPTIERLARIGLWRLVVSDSVPPRAVPCERDVVTLAPTLADVVRRACAAR